MKQMIISLGMLAMAGTASASITPVLVGSPTATGGGIYAYTYDATLATDEGIVAGDYFTLYDFAGFAGFGTVPVDWVPAAPLTGQTPAKTVPTDSASITNVTFTYTGPAFNTSPPTSQHDLGTFVVFATGNSVVFHDFTSLTQLNHGPAAGTAVATIGSNAVGVAGAPVPEPTTWLTMLAGLSLVGVALRGRGVKAVAA